jgi:hypothetical protein
MSDHERIARMREAAAGLLYVRNRLAGDLAVLRAEDASAAEVARVSHEYDEARNDAREALAALATLHASIRSHERERLRARAVELSVTAAALREMAEDALREG